MSENVERWELPEAWSWLCFDQVAEIVPNLVDPLLVMDEPHIAPNHIMPSTRQILPYSTVRSDAVISPKHKFFPGQILFTKIRPYLLKSVIVDFSGVCSADMYPISARKNMNARYLLYWLTSQDFNNEIADKQGRTVLPKINSDALRSTLVPTPPINEQKKIVEKLDRLQEGIERARQELAFVAVAGKSARALLDRLDQAILAKAFRGALLPQDPKDEPASVLLERILAERAATEPTLKRGRRPRVAAGV